MSGVSVKQMKVQKLAGFNRIYQAECFPDEVEKMLGKSMGDKKRYMKWLNERLLVLDRDGMDVLDLVQFEHLRGTHKPKLYAIRHPHSKVNERYIFLFTLGENSLLLTAFKEKNIHDYTRAIKRAENIYSELEEYHER